MIGQGNLVSGGPGLAGDRLSANRGIAFDADGNFYVADHDNNRILVFEEVLQPDLKIGLGAGSLKGNDVYSPTGAGQSVRRVVRKGRKGRFFVAVENDGVEVDTFSLRGNGGTRKFKVRHFRLTGGRTDISGAVKRGTYKTAALAAAGLERFLIEVKPKGRFRKKRASINLRLSATSATDGTSNDLVKGKVKNKP